MANIYTMMTTICLPTAKSIGQKPAGAHIVPTIQGMSRDLQTDERQLQSSISDLVRSPASSNTSRILLQYLWVCYLKGLAIFWTILLFLP